MTLNQLRAFLCAARTGSFTAAAVELRLAQASVSELIRRLEDELGLTLFHRGSRRLVLTSAADELRLYAERAVGAVDEATVAVRSMRTLRGGVVTFGLPRNAPYYRLSDVAEEFHRRFPDVRLRLVGQNSAEIAAAVAEGRLEAGIVVLPIDDSGLTVRPLLRDEVLYASSDPARTRAPVDIENFASARLVLYDAAYGTTDPTRRQLGDRAQLRGVKIEPLVEVEHVDAALRLVARGVGDTFVARAVTESATFPAGIHTVSFAEPIYDSIALIHRAKAPLSPGTLELAALAERTLDHIARG